MSVKKLTSKRTVACFISKQRSTTYAPRILSAHNLLLPFIMRRETTAGINRSQWSVHSQLDAVKESSLTPLDP